MKAYFLSLLGLFLLTASTHVLHASSPQQTVGLDDVQNAIDLGRIPNKDNQPPDLNDWLVTRYNLSLSTYTPTRWFTFKGAPNRRYFFHTTELDAPKHFPLIITFYRMINGRPSPLDSITADRPHLLNDGFYFNTPGDDQRQPQYYLQISMGQPQKQGRMSFTLNVHETEAVWEPQRTVSHTNPVWNSHPRAVQGQWTMDVPAAMEAAFLNQKPILLYEAGLRWDPRSIFHDNVLFTHNAMNTCINQTYPVMLDNCKADGSGPALLTDPMPEGYLEAHHVPDDQATRQLEVNRRISKDFALPEEEAVPNATFLYCRIIHLHGNDYVMEPVGRFGQDITTAETAVTTMRQLNTLFYQGHREAYQYPQTTTLYIPPNLTVGDDSITLGGPVASLWIEFTSNSRGHEGEAWVFRTKPRSNVPQGTIFTLEAYDSTGTTCLQKTSATYPEQPMLTFMSKTRTQTKHFLKISAPNLMDLVNLTLTFQQREIISELTLPQTTITVARNEKKVQIPLQLKHYGKTSDPIAFQYRTAPTSTHAAPSNFYETFSDWRTFTWKDKSKTEDVLPITLHVPASAENWTNHLDFQVECRTVNYTCNVRTEEPVTIRILSLPIFDPPPPANVELYRGLTKEIKLPIIPVGNTGALLDGTLPKGLKLLTQHANDVQNPHLSIIGAPETDSQQSSFTDIHLTQNGHPVTTPPHSATIAFTVQDIDLPAASINAFTGLLMQPEPLHPTGCISLIRQAKGWELEIQVQGMPQPLKASLLGWTDYHPQTKQLTLEHSFGQEGHVSIVLEADGTGKGTFTRKQETLYGDLNPVTAKPQEFVGSYVLALTDSQQALQGWLTLNLNQQGLGTVTTTLLELPLPVTTQAILYDQGETGRLDLFIQVPGDAYSTHNLLLSSLHLVPQAKRPSTAPQDWIGDQSDSLLLTANGPQPVTVHASAFDSHSSITQTVQQDALTWQAEPIDQLEAFAPTAILLQEPQRFSLSPASQQGVLGSQLAGLQVKQDGTFTGTMTVLIPQGSRPVTQCAVSVQGIMIPLPQSDATPVGYGFFTYPAGSQRTYTVRLLAGATATRQAMPELSQWNLTADTMSVTCKAAAQAVLCQNEQLGMRIFTWPSQTSGTLELSTQDSSWHVIALPGAAGQQESQPVVCGSSRVLNQTYNPQDPTCQLQPGWNLIAIPNNLGLSKEATFNTAQGASLRCFQYDEESQCLSLASSLETGQGYWLFVPTADPITMTTRLLDRTPRQTPPPRGWSLKAAPRIKSDASVWSYDQGRYNLVPDATKLPATKGVWLYQP